MRGVAKLTEGEKRLVRRLKDLLHADEWSNLPQLVAARKENILTEIQSDRDRREQRERAEQEERARRRREEEEERRKQARKQALIDRLLSTFEADFLAADATWQTDSDRDLLSSDEYEQLKADFVKQWARENLGESHRLDPQQVAVIGATGADLKVVARAGSGKTHTLISRATFLQEHCGVAPGSLSLLAFNRKAAAEIKERLGKILGDDLPHVMTFHALAHALLHPDEELIYDKDAEQRQQSRLIQDVIDDHLQSDVYRPLIRKLMMSHFRDDWEEIEEGGFHLPIPELIKYRLALPRETLNEEYVKSFGGKLIANTLFCNDVDYKYQRGFRWGEVNYRPDFTILLENNRGIVIEYFGLRGDADYDKMSVAKRSFWKAQKGWTFIEATPADIISFPEGKRPSSGTCSNR